MDTPLISIPDITLPKFVFKDTDKWASGCALQDGHDGHSYSHGQVRDLVYNVAAGLADYGIRKGDVVMMLLPNLPEYPVIFLGIIASGAVVTTINPAYGPTEIRKQLLDSGARLIFTSSEYLEKTKAAAPGVQCVIVGGPAPQGMLSLSAFFAADGSKALTLLDGVSSHDVCALPYSSGTTGNSKGVMLTHHNLVANVLQHLGGPSPRLYIPQGEVGLGLLPMFHIYAITCINLVHLCVGAKIVTLQRFEFDLFLRTLEEHSVSLACLVPPIILAMAKHPIVDKFNLASLRRVVSGAAPLGSELEAAFKRRFLNIIIGQGYGMTESSPVIALSRVFSKDGGSGKPGSAGALLPLTQAKIVDTATGRILPTNQAGELWIKGPQVMKGYLNNEKATQETVDSDGWLHTGDVALIDKDGEVFIVDRLKELIKYKGFQVPPAELEGILVSHPQILDAAVIPAPDEEAGEVPVAFVVLRGGGSLGEEDVKAFVAKQVATYKRLHKVYFVSSIPKSASGKVLRRELRSKL